MTTTTYPIRKPNRFAGTCEFCETRVAADAGYITGKNSATSKWDIAHLPGECPTPAPVPVISDEMWIDGEWNEARYGDYGNWCEAKLAEEQG